MRTIEELRAILLDMQGKITNIENILVERFVVGRYPTADDEEMEMSGPKIFGSRKEVYDGNALKTTSNLTKNDFVENPSGRIVSRHKLMHTRRDNRLSNAGYGSQKGKFGFVAGRKTKKFRNTSS